MPNIITCDAETFWSQDYTLSKLTPIEYCYGPEFELQSMATKINDEATVVTFGFDETKKLFDSIPWEKSILVGHNCVTPDHEVLTPTGWVRFDTLTGKELIAQWDHHTGAAQFVPYTLVKHAHKGTMLKYGSSFHKGIYTPDHRAYWRQNKVAPWRVTTVEEMSNQSPNRPYVPSSATRLVGFQTTGLSVDEARLLEAFRADGCWTQKGSMQFGFKKLRKVSRLTLLLDVLGLRYSYKVRAGVHCFLVSKGQPPVERVRGLIGSSKSFGPTLLTIPPEAQRAIVEETKYWDGSDWGGKTSHVLTTCDKDTAEWLQILAVLNGHGFKYSTKPMSSKWAKVNSMVFQGMVRERAQVKTLYAPEEIQYDGDVYCVQVPSQAFFVRREGAAWVTGNCSEFDALILAGHGRDHFGLNPKLWACTLAMARPIHAKTVGGSLKALAEHYGLQAKGSLEATNTKGLRLADFTPGMRRSMAEYNALDVDITYELFKILVKQTPTDELRLIDATIRMLVEPRFECDVDLLRRGLKAERKRKERLLADLSDKLGIAHDPEQVRKTCASAAKFKDLLTSLGVEVPTKTSPTTGKAIPALAKTDQAMKDLQEHSDEVVQAAAEARLGVRSTILETRMERLITMAGHFDGKMPIPLRYYGADTTGRFSGTMAVNLQNLPRVYPWKASISDVLRHCLRAPEGHKVVVADLSGIELRVNLFLWQVPYAMKAWRKDRKADLYVLLAAEVFSVPVGQVTKAQRQAAKAMLLGCGYGLGNPDRYIAAAKALAQIDVTVGESKFHIASYRTRHPEVVDGWKSCGTALDVIHTGKQMYDIDPWGLCVATKQGIKTPRGGIRYPGLHTEDGDKGKQEWWYGSGRSRARIYSAKCLAEGTLVLTDSGWKPIELVDVSDQVHDGIEFVNHGGKLFKGVQECVMLDGVNMTPNHGVLTDDGWQEASQFPRLYRPDLRGVDRSAPAPHRREEVALGVSMSVREHGDNNRNVSGAGGKTWRDAELRVHDACADRGGQHRPRNVQPPSLRGVPEYDRPLSATHAPGMEKLWRAWDCGVSIVASVVRELLGGHGTVVPAWAHAGQEGQRGGLLPGELSLGVDEDSDGEQTQFGAGVRCGDDRQADRSFQVDAVLLGKERADAAGDCAEGRRAPVWDIMNSGPLNRFVVLGGGGPFVVHNCTENLVQHLSRHVMTDAMLAYMKEGIAKHAPIVHTVHDEVILIAPDDLAQESLDILQDKLRTPPTWWPELITYSEGSYAQTYGSAK